MTDDPDPMRGQPPSTHLGLRLYDEGLSIAQMTMLAQRAEARGYDIVWVPESAGREAFTQLGVYALATRSLRLATGIVNVYTRSPSLLAMALATLDEVSGGRAILGLGIGHREALAQEHGVVFTQPFERMREYVSLVRAVLRGDRLPSAPLCRVSQFRLAFSPERRAVPIYLAALGPRMCELAGEIADGVLLNWVTPTYAEYAVSRVRVGAERAGHNPSAIRIACYLRTAVSGDSSAAEAALARQLTDYIAKDFYRRMLEESGFSEDIAAVVPALPRGTEAAALTVSDRLLAAVALFGSDAARRARLEEYRRAGVTQPVVAPVGATQDPLESWTMAVDAFAPMRDVSDP